MGLGPTRGIRRMQVVIVTSYSYDAAMLVGFYFAHYVSAKIPVTFAVLCATCVGAVALAHVSGWSRKTADPTLFLPQQLFAICIALTMAVLAPQIAFQPFATLFAICAFGFMAPNTRSFVISWSAGAIGALTIILLLGPQLEMPTSTLAGQIVTGGVVLGLLARCIWIATFVRGLQLRLKEKNKALEAAMIRIEALANLDELTNLPNRRAITSWLNEQIETSARVSLPLTVGLVDLDHFKRINDRFGHQAGDRALQIFARLAASSLRKTDRIGRFGGEEFLVVLLGTPLEAAKEVFDRIRDQLRSYDWNGLDADLTVTATIGGAAYIPGETAESLIRRADTALYLGKESGRDRVVLSHSGLSDLVKNHRGLSGPIAGELGAGIQGTSITSCGFPLTCGHPTIS